MYINNIVDFQGSTIILNACTKKSGNLLNSPRLYIYIYTRMDDIRKTSLIQNDRQKETVPNNSLPTPSYNMENTNSAN